MCRFVNKSRCLSKIPHVAPTFQFQLAIGFERAAEVLEGGACIDSVEVVKRGGGGVGEARFNLVMV